MGSKRAFVTMLDTASTINGAATVGPNIMQQADESSHYIVFGANTTAGAVTVEAAHDPNYTGTWAALGTATWAAATRVHNIAITGPHMAIRHRVSTTIANGTVSSSMIVNA